MSWTHIFQYKDGLTNIIFFCKEEGLKNDSNRKFIQRTARLSLIPASCSCYFVVRLTDKSSD
jgi:hypothetical protein